MSLWGALDTLVDHLTGFVSHFKVSWSCLLCVSWLHLSLHTFISCILVVTTLPFIATNVSAPISSGVLGGNFLRKLRFRRYLVPEVSWTTNDLGSSASATTVAGHHWRSLCDYHYWVPWEQCGQWSLADVVVFSLRLLTLLECTLRILVLLVEF